MNARLYWIRPAAPLRLAIMPRPRGGDWLADDLRSLRRQGVDTIVSLLTTHELADLDLLGEAAGCEAASIQLLSLPIADRSLPPDLPQFGALVSEVVTQLRADRSVAIHCRAGIGRSAVLAAFILNYFGYSSDDAIRLIAASRGCDVPDTAEQSAWIAAFCKTRAP